MELKIVNYSNFKEAIRIQNKIFPLEDGTINILASLDINEFVSRTGIDYEDDFVKYYIAYEDDVSIGITGIYKTDDDTAWLAWFGILPEHRRKGYGEKLLKMTMELAKEQKYKFFRLYTDILENNNAVKLYQKMGFIGEKYSKEKLSYDCYIYSKSLCDLPIELWNNKFLGLAYQSKLDHISKDEAVRILKMYEGK